MRGTATEIVVDLHSPAGEVRFFVNGNECWLDSADVIALLGRALWIGTAGYLKAHTRCGDETFVHRIIMRLEKGDKRQVDHINANKRDNRRRNLRVVDQSANNCNFPLRVDSVTGVTGVRWDKARERWAAQIAVNKRTIPLGRFARFEDAVAARRAAEDLYHGQYAARHGAQRERAD